MVQENCGVSPFTDNSTAAVAPPPQPPAPPVPAPTPEPTTQFSGRCKPFNK